MGTIIVDRKPDPKAYPHLCFSHGGSDACEKYNKGHGFRCPRCEAELPVGMIAFDVYGPSPDRMAMVGISEIALAQQWVDADSKENPQRWSKLHEPREMPQPMAVVGSCRRGADLVERTGAGWVACEESEVQVPQDLPEPLEVVGHFSVKGMVEYFSLPICEERQGYDNFIPSPEDKAKVQAWKAQARPKAVRPVYYYPSGVQVGSICGQLIIE